MQNSHKYRFINLDCIDSTNRFAKELDGGENTVIIANRQTAGRGRLGRTFHSLTDGIYMSIILRPTLTADKITLITTATAVAVSRAIDDVFDVKTSIKWVNDIYLYDKKVCGILCENVLSTSPKAQNKTIVGIGINLSSDDGDFPDEIKDIAGFILSKRCSPKLRQALINKILDNFSEIYEAISDRKFLDEYRRRLFIIGQRVLVNFSNKNFPATVLGLNDNANLIVRDDQDNIHTLTGGEVSLKIEKQDN